MPRTNKNKSKSHLGMPNAPWIYISDPTPGTTYSKELAALIPDVLQLNLDRTVPAACALKIPKKCTSLVLITDPRSDNDNLQKTKNSSQLKERAINVGSNFASVNIMNDVSKVSAADNFGTNHLNISAAPGIAAKISKWLCEYTLYLETSRNAEQRPSYCSHGARNPLHDPTRRDEDLRLQALP